MEAGCRVVFANSDRDAVGFYEKMGFARFFERPSSGRGGAAPAPSSRADGGADGEGGLVPMYFDIKPRES